MAIKEFITLEGVQEIEAQLKKLAATGEQSLAQFGKPLPDMKLPEIDSKPIEETTGHVVKLTEVLHTLRPILQAAGLQFSEFGALTRLAGTSLLALAAATAGAVVVGLAKLEENAARTKGVLADLFGSSAKGEQAFGALEKQAGQFGTTVEGLAPGLESFQAALNNIDRTAQGFRALKEADLPGAQLAKNADALTESYGNFIKLLRAGRLDQDQAEKSAKAFFDTLKEGGTVTSAALRNLPAGTINLLKDAFGQAGSTTKQFFALVDTGAISVDALEKALINFGPQAQQAFDTKAIKTFSDEFGKILVALREGFKSLSGGTPFSDFIIGELKRIREGIEATITDLQRLKQFETATGSDVIGKAVTSIRDSIRDATTTPKQGFDEAGFTALADAVQKLPPKFLDANNSLQKLGATGLIAGSQVSQGIDQASASLQKMRDQAKETGQELQTSIIGSTAFKGRLNQIPVFQPQLAGEGSADAQAKAIQKTFIDNPAFKDGIPIPIKPEIKADEFQQSLDSITQQVNTAGTQAGTDFAAAFSETITGQIGSLAQSWWQAVQSVFNNPVQVQFQNNSFLSGQPTSLAGGGMVRGRGSTTSDSILAWLSNQEFVVNARAVSHYGPDLFAALNAMRLPRDFMGRFNMGGLARAISGNRFASGGQVTATSTLVLNIGGRSFEARANEATITSLRRFAVNSQLASIGRKPGFVR